MSDASYGEVSNGCSLACPVQEDQVRKVGLSRYGRVSRTAFGLNGKKRIAVLRAGGAILGEPLPHCCDQLLGW